MLDRVSASEKTNQKQYTEKLSAVNIMNPKGLPSTSMNSGDLVASGPQTIEIILKDILAKKHLAVACRWSYKENPITGETLFPCKFFDELNKKAKQSEIVVLDHDPEEKECPYCYILSRNLMEIAMDIPVFVTNRNEYKRLIEADEKHDYDISPWGGHPKKGANLFGATVRSVEPPVLAICRIRMDLSDDGEGEPNYVFGTEIPVLSRYMSVFFDIEENGTDWADLAPMLDYFVDDLTGQMALYRGNRGNTFS